ncbi:hypothetical protein Tco_1169615, partial [Tanacetum coccineum]
MVTYLEKSDENAEFHHIVDFLSTCSINYALTVSPTIFASYIEQFWNTATSKTVNSVKQIHVIVDGKAVVISESSVRSDLLFDDKDGITCLTNDEIFENLTLMGYEQLSTKLTFQKGGGNSVERAITTDASLDATHDSDNILKTQTTAMPNVDIPQGMATGGSPRHQDTMGVLDLEKEKDAQAVEILNLKKRVKKLERQRKSSISHSRRRTYKQVESSDYDLDEEDASKQGRKSDTTKPMSKESDFDEIDDLIENVEGETVDAATTGVSTVSAPVTTAGITISTAEPRTPPITTVFDDDKDLTIAQTLVKMRSEKAKEKEKGVAFRDEEEPPRLTTTRSTTTLQPLPTIDPKDKGKGVLVEEESKKPVKIKRRDQGLAQIESDAERVEQEEASVAALYEEYDTIQASIDTDALFAAKLQQEEREQFTIEERAKFLNMGKFNHSQLKGKSYEALQRLYEREQKWISDFVPMDSEKEAKKTVEPESEDKLAGGSRKKIVATKRIVAKLDKESAKRQKLEDATEE